MADKPSYMNALGIHKLAVDVRLGITEEERHVPQKIMLDIRLYMPSLMSCAFDDDGDYICYHDISQKIYDVCVSKEYRLIEYLSHEIYHLMRGIIPEDIKIWIKLHKTKILLHYVTEGASYTYTDLPSDSWVLPN